MDSKTRMVEKQPNLEEALGKLDLKGSLVLLNILSNRALSLLIDETKNTKTTPAVIMPNNNLVTATSTLLPII